MEGGSPVAVATATRNSELGLISPDGKWIAYVYRTEEQVPRLRIGIMPSDGGATIQTLTMPNGALDLVWSPDGKGLQYLLTKKGATNVWEQRLAGGEPRLRTNFTSGEIFGFAWTRDGKTLLLTKGEITRDVVLISNFR